MKKYLLNIATILMVALVSVCMTSCGSDDDDDNGGSGSGSASVAIDGKSFNFGYAYWNYVMDGNDPQYQISFYDYDMEKYLKSGKMPETLTTFAVCIRKSGDENVLPTGTFKDFWVAISQDEVAQQSSDGHTIYGVSYYGDTNKSENAQVTVSKSGSKYTVKVSGLDIYTEDDNSLEKVAENISFTYTGNIASVAELMKKYGIPEDEYNR